MSQDWTGAQIGNNDSTCEFFYLCLEKREYHLYSDSDDVRNVNLTKVHNLSGPIAVEGAEPGDCLVVDILDGEHHLKTRESRLNVGYY